MLLLQGCPSAPRVVPEALHVYVTPSTSSADRSLKDHERQLAVPLLRAFARIHPDVRVRLVTIPEANLQRELLVRQRRGLGPDLLMLRAPLAIALHRKGLIAPLPQAPELATLVSSIEPSALERVRDRGALVALPVASQFTLACYNSRRVPSPPRTLDELLALAASGRSVGLSLEPIGLWWTAGALGASTAMAPVLTGLSTSGDVTSPSQRSADRRAVSRWLAWLRQAAQQSRIDIGTGPDDLTSGLVSGRLDWIPCFSMSLQSLKAGMGPRLGVSSLPDGPGGPASPFSSLRVLAFGTDSSPQQQQLALELARLSLNPTLQRAFTLTTREVLPVNRYVQVPYSSSGWLSAMAEAQHQFRLGSSVMNMAFSSDRVGEVLPQIENLAFEAIVGVSTPEDAAEAMLKLRDRP